MTKSQLTKAKAELKRLNAFIEANEPTTGFKATISKKKHKVDGYVYVEPCFDDPAFVELFRAGAKRLAWGAEGKGHPRWIKSLGLYSVLKSAL